jgi:tRNA-(ms[2]io[6]A)-hydroxylase
VLNLAAPTRPDWLDEARADIDTVLLDHAHCEKKAASTAMNLIFRYVEEPWLMAPLSALAREELAHFELMLKVLDERGVGFRRIEPSPYAAKLLKAVRKEEPLRLLDTLLCCSLIEARSCERMKLLAENLEDPKLAGLYRSLLASEARHHHGYVEMAMERFGRDVARERLAELAAHEAEILATPGPVLRMHS